MTLTGGCRCGAARYTIDRVLLPPVYACHCHLCQRWSGSAFSLQALVPEEALSVSGPIATFETSTEDRISTQRVCASCHTRLYNTNTRGPGMAVVRAGTLDRSEELVCRAHIFTNYRQHWFTLPDDVPCWGEAPALDALVAVLDG